MSAPKATMLGGFVLGGLALGVCAILMFSSMRLFKTRVHAVVVFRDSVAGLSVGSAVTFRGVQIGQVKEMKVHFNVHDHTPVIPVFLDLDPGKVVWTNGTAAEGWDLQDAVKAGLRAQLTQQSLITGLMTVNLDLYPKALAAPVQFDDGIVEIPAIPSEIEMLKDQVAGLNLPALGEQTRQALTSLQHTLDQLSANIAPLSAKLGSTLQSTNTAIHAVEIEANRTMDHYARLAVVTQDQISENGNELAALLKTTEEVMIQVKAVVASLDDMTAARSPTRNDLEASLRDLAASASSLREFTHDLERHPVGVLLRRPRP
jgi:paraquat-inducible protein B